MAAEGGWVRAAHDVSDGGLAVALAEMVLRGAARRGLGAEVDLGVLEADADVALFCERAGDRVRGAARARAARCSRPRASARCWRGRSAR